MPIDWATFGVDLHLEIDRTAGRRAGLERALREAIRSGRLAAHARLPSTRGLAAELGLSRGTVTAAYDHLVAEGYLVAGVGSGTTVARLQAQPDTAAVGPAERAPAPRYDLRPGSPDVTTFPTTDWLRATRRALAVAPASAYDYGDPRGRIELRTALAEYLGRTRGVSASPDRILVTTGAIQALALLTGVLAAGSAGARAGQAAGVTGGGSRTGGVAGGGRRVAVAMEDPGLAFHREVVRRAGAEVLPLPVDHRGARADLLSTVDFSGVRAAVVTPAHQYPTGVTLAPDRRLALARWARQADGLLIEDDYDGEFRYDRQPVGALQGMAPDRVAYLGTAAKTLGPALRLAWLVLPEWLMEPVVDAKRHADLHSESVGQLALADLIGTHAYDRHVRACRLRYRRRRDLLIDRLGAGSTGRFAVRGISAGLHVLVDLPPGGPTEHEVLAEAARHGLALSGLGEHWHDQPDGSPQGIIVGYGTPPQRRYPAALDALARVLRTAGMGPLVA